MTLENIVYACYEEHKKHTSNWQHGKPQKAYYDLEGLKIFYEDGKIWHYRPIDENTSNFVKPTGSQKTSEIRYRENFWIKSLKNLDFTRV